MNTFNQYQQLAQRTANPNMNKKERLTIAALGLAGESGEVADHVKKWAGHGHVLDVDHMKKELGDILWYVQEVAEIVGVPLHTIAHANIEKLKKRYPQGFSEEASRNRTIGD